MFHHCPIQFYHVPFFQTHGEKLSEEQLTEMLNEVDLNKNGQIDVAEFLQVVSISSGLVHTPPKQYLIEFWLFSS